MKSRRSSMSLMATLKRNLLSSTVSDCSVSFNADLEDPALLFQAGNFIDCLRVLDQLCERTEGDPKVIA